MDADVAFDVDRAERRIDLDDCGMHAVGPGGMGWAVVVDGLDPGSLPLGQRRPVVPAGRRELGRGLRGLVEGVAQGIGGRRDLGQGDRAVAPLDARPAVIELDVVLLDFQHVGGGFQDQGARLERRLVDRVAADHGGAARERGHAPAIRQGVAGDEDHVLDPGSALVGDDLGKDGFVALPLPGEPGVDVDPAGDRMDLDPAAFVGPEARAFDVEPEPEPQVASLRQGIGLLGAECLEADRLDGPIEGAVVIAAVVADGEPVGEEQPFPRPGEFVLGDEVAPAHLDGVQAQLAGKLVHGPFDGEAGLRPPAAPVGGDLDRRRIDRLELDLDVRDPVRTGDRGRGHLRDGDAVGDEGAGVVQETILQPEHPAVPGGRQLDGVDLRALLGGAEEVLAPVLDVLDRPFKLDRGQRHQDLVGCEHHDLLAEAAAHVGRHDPDVVLVEIEDRRQAPAHRERRLGGVPDHQLPRDAVPPGGHRLALQRRRGAAVDLDGDPGEVLGFGKRLAGIAAFLDEVGGDVVRDVVVDERCAVRHGPLQVHLHGEGVVVDVDQPGRVFGHVAVDRDDHRDRLPDVADLAAGERALGLAAPGDAGVGDEQRQLLVAAADVVAGVDRHDAFEGLGLAGIDRQEPRPGELAAYEGDVETPVERDVVHVAPFPPQQAWVGVSLDGGAERSCRHRALPAPIGLGA